MVKNKNIYEIMLLEIIGLKKEKLNLIVCLGCVVVRNYMVEMGY